MTSIYIYAIIVIILIMCFYKKDRGCIDYSNQQWISIDQFGNLADTYIKLDQSNNPHIKSLLKNKCKETKHFRINPEPSRAELLDKYIDDFDAKTRNKILLHAFGVTDRKEIEYIPEDEKPVRKYEGEGFFYPKPHHGKLKAEYPDEYEEYLKNGGEE